MQNTEKLLKNNNFLNNQNYIISNFQKSFFLHGFFIKRLIFILLKVLTIFTIINILFFISYWFFTILYWIITWIGINNLNITAIIVIIMIIILLFIFFNFITLWFWYIWFNISTNIRSIKNLWFNNKYILLVLYPKRNNNLSNREKMWINKSTNSNDEDLFFVKILIFLIFISFYSICVIRYNFYISIFVLFVLVLTFKYISNIINFFTKLTSNNSSLKYYTNKISNIWYLLSTPDSIQEINNKIFKVWSFLFIKYINKK